MNIRLHHKTFAAISTRIQRQLYGVAADTLAESRRTIHRVHAEMYGPCVGPRHLDVSYDGIWKKRGFQSPFGVGFMIDTLTGLVIDYAVLSKYCFECEQVGKQLSGEELEMWKQLHVDQCAINHTGSTMCLVANSWPCAMRRRRRNKTLLCKRACQVCAMQRKRTTPGRCVETSFGCVQCKTFLCQTK